MAALRSAFVIPSRRNASAVSGGSSAGMLNANEPMSRVGGMLGAMIVAMIVAMAQTKNAAETSPLKKGTVGVALRFDGSAAAIDLKGEPSRVGHGHYARGVML
jgi:hypothetical protein